MQYPNECSTRGTLGGEASTSIRRRSLVDPKGDAQSGVCRSSLSTWLIARCSKWPWPRTGSRVALLQHSQNAMGGSGGVVCATRSFNDRDDLVGLPRCRKPFTRFTSDSKPRCRRSGYERLKRRDERTRPDDGDRHQFDVDAPKRPRQGRRWSRSKRGGGRHISTSTRLSGSTFVAA